MSFTDQKMQKSAQESVGQQSVEKISRKEAKALGLTRYFTGGTCKHGHKCERQVSNRSCLLCLKIRGQKWRVNNIEKSRLNTNNNYAKTVGKQPSEIRKTLPAGYWTYERCFNEAKKYKCLESFQSNSTSAYNAANRGGFFHEITEHIKRKRKPDHYWDRESCRKEALKHTTQTSFKESASSAYNSAKKFGIFKEITSHMTRLKRESNLVYIWRVDGVRFNGENVYKIGVSSDSLVKSRVCTVSRAHDVNAVDLITSNSKDPFLVEKEMLSKGVSPRFIELDGHTEFRAMTNEDYSKVISIMNNN